MADKNTRAQECDDLFTQLVTNGNERIAKEVRIAHFINHHHTTGNPRILGRGLAELQTAFAEALEPLLVELMNIKDADKAREFTQAVSRENAFECWQMLANEKKPMKIDDPVIYMTSNFVYAVAMFFAAAVRRNSSESVRILNEWVDDFEPQERCLLVWWSGVCPDYPKGLPKMA